MTEVNDRSPKIEALREMLGRTFPAVDAVFDELALEAVRLLDAKGVDDWLAGGKFLGRDPRGSFHSL